MRVDNKNVAALELMRHLGVCYKTAWLVKHKLMEVMRVREEDDRGVVRDGKDGVSDLVEQWRHAGALIPERSARREAFNVMLSMPAGTPASAILDAARAFARSELHNHRYVMVLHTHQANPHVHLSVRAEGKDGQRLNPRKADLRRWRETFAEKLRDLRIEA